jgi:threonine/homoserine/homoserine lactone efflux protein
VPSLATLAGFVAIVFVFAAVPGPSNLYVVARGLRAGRGPALAAALGCALGASVYVAATAAGLAALLASSAAALSALHYAGGAYLLLLGVRALRHSRHALDDSGDSHGRDVDPGGQGTPRESPSLWQGFLVELGNPKVALFFLAFFPQFVHPARGAAWSQVLVLGAVFCLVGLLSDSLYALGSGSLRQGLRSRARWLRRSERASGFIYLGLGAWAIASGARAEAR